MEALEIHFNPNQMSTGQNSRQAKCKDIINLANNILTFWLYDY